MDYSSLTKAQKVEALERKIQYASRSYIVNKALTMFGVFIMVLIGFLDTALNFPLLPDAADIPLGEFHQQYFWEILGFMLVSVVFCLWRMLKNALDLKKYNEELEIISPDLDDISGSKE